MCSYFCKYHVVTYRKCRNVPIFKDISPICYFLGFAQSMLNCTLSKKTLIILHYNLSVFFADNITSPEPAAGQDPRGHAEPRRQ